MSSDRDGSALPASAEDDVLLTPVEALCRELAASQGLHEGGSDGAALASLERQVMAGAVEGEEDVSAITTWVSLCKGPGNQRFGVVCACLPVPGRGCCFVVTAVEPLGLVELWNDSVRDKRRIHLGCSIWSVNGTHGDVQRMQRELETSTEVRLCICNPPNAFCMKRALEACEGGPIASWQVVKDPLSGTSPGPELECNITVVITTSPVPSNPSTELLERVLLSLHRIPGLRAAPKLIACDGHRRSAGKANHKAGKVTLEESENYQRFIAQLQTSQCSAESTSPYFKCRVLALEEHQGFGFAVKSALEEVDTEFVLVVQHDQEFIAAFNLPQVLSAMTQHEELKYVGLSSVSTLNYDNMVRSKFGVAISQTLEFGIPLMPLIFFYDKPHICRTAHYRDLLGPGSLVRKGEFIEETLGVAQREDIIKHGMDAHAKYGTFQLDFRDEYGGQFAVVRHLNGRAFLSPEQRVARGWTATLRFAA